VTRISEEEPVGSASLSLNFIWQGSKGGPERACCATQSQELIERSRFATPMFLLSLTQSVIARLEDAEYTGHSLTMLERIATACGVALKLHTEKKPNFDREVALA